jgi:hypothetical protein
MTMRLSGLWGLVWTASLALSAATALAASNDYQERVERVLKQTPLIDGHNDLP